MTNHIFRASAYKGIVRSRLMRLTWPIFVETSLMMMLGMGDIFMLGSYSDYSVAAVGVVNQILNMVFLLFGVVTTGTSVLCARYLGERDDASVKALVSVSILFNLCFGALMSVVLAIYAPEILTLMDLRPELMGDAVSYMRIVSSFAFMQSLSLTLSAILRSLQRPKFPMMAILIVNIINVIGNYTFIYGHFGAPELGVEGAAIATVISRTVSVAVLVYSLFKVVMPDFTTANVLPFRWDKLREVLHIGLPSAGEHISYSLSQVIVLYFINMVSNEALIARTYVANIVMAVYLFAFSIAQSNSITAGFLFGERRCLAAHRITIFSVRLTIFISLVIGTLIALSGKHIVALLTDNAEVIALSAIVVWIDVLLEIGRALNMIVIQALRAVGDYIFPVAFGALSVWGIATGMSYVLGIYWGLGLAGIWWAFTIDENFRGVAMLRRWNRMDWARK